MTLSPIKNKNNYKKNKKIIYTLLISFIIFIVVTISLRSILINKLKYSLKNKLRTYGITNVDFTIKKITLHRLTIDNININNKLIFIKQLKINYTLSQLFEKKINKITVTDFFFNKKKLLSFITTIKRNRNRNNESQSKVQSNNQGRANDLTIESRLKEIPIQSFLFTLNPAQYFSSSNISIKRLPLKLTFNKSDTSFKLESSSPIIVESFLGFKNLEINLKIQLKLIKNTIAITVKQFNLSGNNHFENERFLLKNLMTKIKKESFIKIKINNLQNKKSKSLPIKIIASNIIFEKTLANLTLTKDNNKHGKNTINLKLSKTNLSITGSDQNTKINVNIGSLKQLDHIHFFKKLSIKSNVHIIKKSKKVKLSIQISDSENAYNLVAQAHSNFTFSKINSKFSSSLNLAKISQFNFINTLPFLKKMDKKINNLTGKISINGKINLRHKKLIPHIKIVSKNINFKWDKITIKKINLTHYLDDFSTFQSNLSNILSIDEIDNGTKFNNIFVNYKINNINSIFFKKISLNTFKGKITITPFSIDNKEIKHLTIQLQDFPLQKILNLGLKNEIQATGNLNGKLPIFFVNKIPLIKGGILYNTSSGKIIYKPSVHNPLKSMGLINLDLLFNYLQDFSYQKIKVDVNSNEQYNLTLNSSILGSNPATQNGRPLKFGFNLFLNIKNAIISSLMFMKIPKTIEQQILKGKGL